MTGLYVQSNAQSIISQNQLKRNMSALSDTLTRLSTGLKINSGKDDPAGLIASELLKSDIKGTSTAISNAQRANSIIGIADSALGQVGNLLNDIKGLIVEAANTGAMSADQIAANQMQVDAAIDSIDRIAKTINYQGMKLLDGSLDFQTSGVPREAVADLKIHEANFGTADRIDINVDVKANAERAKLIYDKGGISQDVVLEISGNLGADVLTFQAGASVTTIAEAVNRVSDSTGVRAVVGQEATYGQLLATSAGENNDINFTALLAGYAGGNYTIKYTAGNTSETTYTITEPTATTPGIIEFKLKMEEAKPASVTGMDQGMLGVHTVEIPATGFYIQSDADNPVRSYSIVEADAHTLQPSADYDAKTGHLQLIIQPTTTDAEIAELVNGIQGLTVLDLPSLTGSVVAGDIGTSGLTTDLRTNNALDITAKTPGTAFEDTDVIFLYDPDATDAVSFDYKSNGGKSGLSVANVATGVDPVANGTQFLRLTATQAGADFNEVDVVFLHDANYPSGSVGVTYDADNKRLVVAGQLDGGANAATLGTVKAAIEKNSPFKADFFSDAEQTTAAPLSLKADFEDTIGYYMDGAAGEELAALKTGQIAADLGSNHQALIITVNDLDTTADDVVQMFKDDSLNNLFSIQNSAGSNGSGTVFLDQSIFGNPDDYSDPSSWVYSGILKGGNGGYETAVTARELVELVNSDPRLSQIIRADLGLNTPTGEGKLTLFDEYAYYGDPTSGTGLQFLGPKDSTDIIFASNLNANGTKIPNQQLGMYFTPEMPGYATIDIPAKNPNAAISVTANNKGSEYDDMVVRYVRLDNNHDGQDGFATYTEGPSNAMAYCSINEANTGADTETGKFIVYSTQGSDAYNEVDVVVRLDTDQNEKATARYDENTKQLIVTVNSAEPASGGGVKLTDAIEAINNTGLFKADYDFSFNNATDGSSPAEADFSSVLSGGKTTAVVGNTGQTGGHTGGVLTVYLADDPADSGDPKKGISAQAAVNIINDDPILKELFKAKNYGSSDGTGELSFREDNLKTVTGGCGELITVPTATSTGGVTQKAQMVIQLATDQYGNYTTTAKELVDFFDTLTPEQTRGISVSIVRPQGADNLNRRWTVDECGNVTETRDCEDDYGNGILNPLFELDECEQLVYEVIQFESFGSNIQNSNANDDVVAVNGWESMFNVSSKIAGPEYEGISLVYEKIGDINEAPSARYDETKKEIVVRILEGETTAAQVKAAIEAGETTKDLFNVSLKKDGTAIVTLSDDSLSTVYGTYEAGYRGGARMLGAADEDPHKLVFESVNEGSDQRVTIKVKEGSFSVKDENNKVVDTAYGKDMVATINGLLTTAQGRSLSVSTSSLKMEMVLNEAVGTGDRVQFSINGGGAIFQVGPDVITNQQIRIGIGSINSASLGGANGRLYQLKSGNNADLITSDESRRLADLIVQDAIMSIATTRGRLGAVQKCTLEPTITYLQDSLEALTSAEAQISNADFAEESSNLTRAQILVQSGISTMSIANQFPQYAAALLGG